MGLSRGWSNYARSVVSCDTSGMSEEEYIREVTDGTLTYFHSDIHEAYIEAAGDHAMLEGTVDLTARVYGMGAT